MTPEEARALLAKSKTAGRTSVAPTGATSASRAVGALGNIASAVGGPLNAGLTNAGSGMMLGADDQIGSLMEMGLRSLTTPVAKGADWLVNQIGGDFTDPVEPRGYMEALGANRARSAATREEYPISSALGEVGGVLMNPANQALGGQIATLPKAIQRIAATTGAAAGESGLIEAAQGGDDIMGQAISGGAFGAAGQGIGEAGGKFLRKYGTDLRAGVSRASDIMEDVVKRGLGMEPEDIMQAGAKLGDNTVAGDIVPALTDATVKSKTPLAHLTDFYDFHTNRLATESKNLGKSTKAITGSSTLSPGRITDGIKEYKKALSPAYTSVLQDMDKTGAKIKATHLLEEFKALRTNAETGILEVGPVSDAEKAIRFRLNDMAKELVSPEDLKAANEASKAAGGGIVRPIDLVELTPSHLQSLKWALDDMISARSLRVNKGTATSKEKVHQRYLIRAKNKVKDILEASPAYAELNKKFSGAASAERAYEFGKGALTSKTASVDVEDVFEAMEPGDAQFAIEGIKHALAEDLISEDNIKAAKKLLNRRDLRGKLSTFFTEEGADKLITELDNSLTKIQTSSGVAKKWDANAANEIRSAADRSTREIVDKGLIAGVLANALTKGRTTGPGLYSGAFMGALRRVLGTGPDIAADKAIADFATMSPAEFAKVMKNLPSLSQYPVPGQVGRGAAGASLMEMLEDD